MLLFVNKNSGVLFLGRYVVLAQVTALYKVISRVKRFVLKN